MSQAPSEKARKAGRPRSEAAHAAILGAAYRILMEEGFGRLTIEAVAARANVGKPTIYRYWSNAQELAMAAFLSRPEDEAAGLAGKPVRSGLKSHMQSVIAAFATNRGRQITLTMASSDRDSELSKAFRNQIILKSRSVGRAMLEAADAAGEIAPDSDIETALDMIYGPVFYRLLVGHAPLSPDFGDKIVDIALDGLAHSSGSAT